MQHSITSIRRGILLMLLYVFLMPLFLVNVQAGAVLEPPQFTVSGTVTDTSGNPLAGVNLVVESKNIGTISDLNGSFSINADPSDVLVFSMVGFKTLAVPIAGREEVFVSMEEDVTVLEEVVLNAGYYTVSERERTGSIEKVSAVDIEKQPISNPLAALQGRMAGVQIQQTSGLPGANFNIRIRGRNSIRSDANEPLYIVDGVPFASTSIGEGQASVVLPGGPISPLNNINPSDIESIEVLKDADATAIYGSRGANGVVLITTKKGVRGPIRATFDLMTGLGKVERTLDLLGTSDYLVMRKEAFANDGVEQFPSNAHDVNGSWDPNRYTDWQRVLFGKTSYLTNVQGSISGGNAQTQFLVSGNYHGQSSVFPGDYKNDKVSVLTNLGHRSSDGQFSVQLSTSYTSNRNNLPGDGTLVAKAYSLAPNAPRLYNDDGSLNWENSTWTNPLASFEKKYESNTSTLISNAQLGYKIGGSLELKAHLGYTESHLTEINTSPSTIYDPVYGAGPQYSSALHNQGKRTSWVIEPQLDFTKSFGGVGVKALFGATFQDQRSERLSQYAFGFTSNRLIENLSAASTFSPQADINEQYRYQAIYGRLNLELGQRYFLNLTGRRDGSSRFGPENRFANFGAVGAAWLFSEESFLKDNAVLSFGKIRASYGTTGNDQIGDYQYLDTYSFGTSLYQGVYGLYPTRLYNPDYGWEKNEKLEFALELGWFQDRIRFVGNHYRNRSSNQLLGMPLPGTAGFSSINGNLDATVENTGWELELHTVNVRTDRFSWSTGFNITFPKTRLVSFPNLEGSTYANFLVIDQPLDITKRYRFDGVDASTGLFSFKDLNMDGSITAQEDRVALDLNPKYYGGLTNHFSYGRLDLDILVQFTKQLGLNFWSNSVMPGRMANQPVSVLQRWQGEGDNAAFQQFSNGTPATNAAYQQYVQSDAVVSDASFIRLKNVSIAYRVTKEREHGFTCSLFLRGQNLLTLTDYLGLDPETANPLAVPALRMVTLGTRIGF